MTQEMSPVETSRTRPLPEGTPPCPRRSPGQGVLWALLLLSLALNGVALYWIGAMQRELQAAQGQFHEIVSSARADLQAWSGQPLALQIAIDQTIPISDTVSISDTFTVPIDTVFPFSTQVRTSFNIPLLGRQELSIPVAGSVPVKATFEVPLQAEFPISMTYRLALDLPVEVTLPPEVLQSVDQMLQQLEVGLR